MYHASEYIREVERSRASPEGESTRVFSERRRRRPIRTRTCRFARSRARGTRQRAVRATSGGTWSRSDRRRGMGATLDATSLPAIGRPDALGGGKGFFRGDTGAESAPQNAAPTRARAQAGEKERVGASGRLLAKPRSSREFRLGSSAALDDRHLSGNCRTVATSACSRTLDPCAVDTP
jgi:hypothetical protein